MDSMDRTTSIYKVRESKYVAPVDQYMSEKKNYDSRGEVVEQTFRNFDGFSFSRSLPLHEYNDPQRVPAIREEIGTAGSTGVDGRRFYVGKLHYS